MLFARRSAILGASGAIWLSSWVSTFLQHLIGRAQSKKWKTDRGIHCRSHARSQGEGKVEQRSQTSMSSAEPEGPRAVIRIITLFSTFN